MSKLQGEVRTLPKMSGCVGAKTVGIGEDGATFIPSVSADGIISWTNDKELPNPEPVNIKGVTPVKGVDYFTNEDKVEMVEETKNAVLPLVLEPSYINTDIRIADKGLTYLRGIRAVKIIGSILWVVDSGVYNITADFKTAANHTVYEFTLPKEISNLIPNVNGAYGTTGTLGYFPALAYENTTYTTFNCQSYLKRSAVGETEDIFQIVYTGLNAIKAGSGLCGFHLRMPVLLV